MQPPRRLFPLLLLAVALGSVAAQASRPVASGIAAVPFGTNRVEVTWTLPALPEGSYVSAVRLYRGTRPITGVDGMEPLATLSRNATSYNDTLRDFREYYYAVVTVVRQGGPRGTYTDGGAEEELFYDEEQDGPEDAGEGRPYAVILPGVNATVTGARANGAAQTVSQEVPQDDAAKGSAPDAAPERQYDDRLRESPLPYIDVLGDTQRHRQRTISAEAEARARALAEGRGNRAGQVLESYIFEDDMLSPDGGDEYLLFEILRSSFIRGDYARAIADLQRFLAQNRSPGVAERANFYLGEAYYFAGNFPLAVTSFLQLQEAFPALSRKWIQGSLDRYRIPGDGCR